MPMLWILRAIALWWWKRDGRINSCKSNELSVTYPVELNKQVTLHGKERLHQLHNCTTTIVEYLIEIIILLAVELKHIPLLLRRSFIELFFHNVIIASLVGKSCKYSIEEVWLWTIMNLLMCSQACFLHKQSPFPSVWYTSRYFRNNKMFVKKRKDDDDSEGYCVTLKYHMFKVNIFSVMM